MSFPFRVIEGGLGRPSAARPIVWNRMPIEAQRVALVIQGDHQLATLAVDDGRPFLVGVRDVSADKRHVVHAWIDWAKGEGLEIHDQRAGREA